MFCCCCLFHLAVVLRWKNWASWSLIPEPTLPQHSRPKLSIEIRSVRFGHGLESEFGISFFLYSRLCGHLVCRLEGEVQPPPKKVFRILGWMRRSPTTSEQSSFCLSECRVETGGGTRNSRVYCQDILCRFQTTKKKRMLCRVREIRSLTK